MFVMFQLISFSLPQIIGLKPQGMPRIECTSKVSIQKINPASVKALIDLNILKQ